MKARIEKVYLAVILICFPGYPLLAAIGGAIGAQMTTASMLMRTLNVFLSLALLYCGLGYRRDRWASNLLLVVGAFWFAYMLRLIFDTSYNAPYLSREVSYYWIWAVGGCLIPLLGLAAKPHDLSEAPDFFAPFYLCTLLAGVIALGSASGAVTDNFGRIVETGRLRVGNALNPISLGHLGAMLAIHSVWGILFFRKWSALWSKCLLLAGSGLGFYLLIAANSRGPLIAALVCMCIIIAAVRFRHKIALFAFLGVAALSAVPMSRYLQEHHNINAFSRLFDRTLERQAEQSSRLDLFASALDVFASSPWLGGALEDPLTGAYPHNIFIEGYMAVGAVFGTVLVLGCLFLAVRAFSIFRYYPQFGWPSLLFVQYLLGAQFSGSIATVTHLWPAVGLMISFLWPVYGSRAVLAPARNHPMRRRAA